MQSINKTKTAMPTRCWVWQGATAPSGTPLFGPGIYSKFETKNARQYIYQHTYGQWDFFQRGRHVPKLTIQWRCHPQCVNPKHIIPKGNF
jgi:hypothetical protein